MFQYGLKISLYNTVELWRIVVLRRGRMDSTKESISEFSNDEDLEESPPHHHSLHDITDITDDIECDDEVISHQHTQSLDHVDSHFGIGIERSEIKDSHNLDQTTSSDGEINVRNTRYQQLIKYSYMGFLGGRFHVASVK